jgi:phage-related protein
VGTALAPVVLALARFLSNTLIPAISQAIAWVQKHREGFIQLGKTLIAIGKFLYENIVSPILKAVIPAVKAVIGWVQEHKKGLEQLARFIGGGMKIAIQLIVGVFKFWAAQIRTTAGVVSWLWHDVVQPAAHGISEAWHAISDAAQTMWNFLKGVFGKIHSGLGTLKSFVSGAVSTISDAWKGIGDGLQWAYDHVIKPILDGIMAAVHGVQDAINALNPLKGIDAEGALNSLTPEQRRQLGLPPGGVGNAQGTGFWPGGVTPWNELGGEMALLPNGTQIIAHTAAESRQRMENGAASVKVDVPMDAVVSELRGLRRDMRGMQVTLDGYKIGVVEGRQADRYGRGG